MHPNSMNQVEIVCSWVFRDEHSMLRSSWHFYGFPLHKTLAAPFQCSFYINIKMGGIFMASGRVARTSFANGNIFRQLCSLWHVPLGKVPPCHKSSWWNQEFMATYQRFTRKKEGTLKVIKRDSSDFLVHGWVCRSPSRMVWGKSILSNPLVAPTQL